jgi:glycosyltransferase involved in cell wall biosynthesis
VPAGDRLPSVLLVHERYQQHGGEDAVFEAELALFRRKGRDVRTLVIDNASIPEAAGPVDRLRLGLETIWSDRAARRMTRRLAAEPADIVHIHNTFPLLSPAIHVAAREAGAAVVQTIHNFRPICPAATLFRDGAPCHDCVGKPIAWPSIVHACYRDSRIRTIPVAAMLANQRLRRSWDSVHAIIALTAFAADRLVEGGLPADRIHVKGNFVEPVDAPRTGPGHGYLFAGRLSPAKGLETLVAAAERVPDTISIRVAGDGPSAGLLVEASIRGRLATLGHLAAADLGRELAQARALVFPSQWYEGMPLVILEAFSAGLPVIAARIGAAAELVTHGETGLTFEPGDADGLARAMIFADDHPDEMVRLGENARRAYERSHTPDASYDALLDIHAAALERAQQAGRGQASMTETRRSA